MQNHLPFGEFGNKSTLYVITHFTNLLNRRLMDTLFFIVPLAALLALGFAIYFYQWMKKEDEGTERMKEIAQHVRSGAMAYLKQQYKVVNLVFIALAVLFAVMACFGLQNPWVPFAFLTGGFFSGLAGFFGMKTATYASARTANAARQSLNGGLKIAFRSGAVMGLTVVGLALLDIAIWYLILTQFVEGEGGQKLVVITTTMLTFGMGASTQAFLPVSAVESTPKLQMSVQTLSAKLRLEYPKMTLATLPPSPIMSVITLATSLEWVQTSTSRTLEPS